MPRAVLVCLLGLLALPAGARAHAAFVGSAPAAGTRVEAAPERIVLSFTEPLNRALSRAELIDAGSGREVPAAVSAPVADRLILRPQRALARGAYVVRWHTVSTQDGHALEGSFSFGVRAAAAQAGHALEESPFARGGWLRALARLGMYVALLLFAGGLFLRLLIGERWRPGLLRDAGLVAAAAAAVAVALEAADAAGGLAPAGLRDFLLANLAGIGRVALVALTAAAALASPRAAAVLVLGALGALAASGHAGSAEPRLASILIDWVHLTSGALWLGGLAMIVLAATDRRDALRRFAPVALPAFAIVVVTGGLSLIIQLDRLSDLVETAYGRVLAVKIALVALIAFVAWLHQGRRWRLIRVEPLIGVGVAAAVALLVTFPLPPRQLADAAQALAATPPTLPRVAADELSVADGAGPYLIAAWIRRDGSGEVRALDGKLRPARVALRLTGARASGGCGTGCVRFAGLRAPRLEVRAGGHAASLPAHWRAGGRQQLLRAERAMRALPSLRSVEEVSSGPGTRAVTAYQMRAPDRMRWRTGRGVESIVIGRDQWQRTPELGWLKGRYGGGLPFSLRRVFRWSAYASAVRRLGPRELALADPATPVWHRLTLDRRGRVVREQVVARARFVEERFFDFGAPVEIDAPE